MSYGGGYPGQAPNAPYQGAPQPGYGGAGHPYQAGPPQGYPGASPYQGGPGGPGAPPPAGYPGAAPAAGAPYQQQQQQQQPGGYGGAPPQQPGYGGQPGVSQEVMSWFRAVDQDNSGFINASELSRALQSGNSRNFSVQACSTMMGMFDHQRTGRIDVQQFAQLFGFINQWTEAFRRADTDRSGNITVQEMMPVLQAQGYNISLPTVQLMVQKYGSALSPSAGGGAYQGGPPQSTLGLDGFILVSVQLKRLTDVFRQKDSQQQGRITLAYEEFIGMVVNTV